MEVAAATAKPFPYQHYGQPLPYAVGQLDAHARFDLLEAKGRARASMYLLIGTSLGISATLYSISLVLGGSETADVNMFGRPFPSGNKYVFASAGELVMNTKVQNTAVYTGAIVLAMLFLILSQYPHELSNVSLAGRTRSTAQARAVLPALGLFLSSVWYMSPPNVAAEYAAPVVHCIGMLLCVGSYTAFELIALLAAGRAQLLTCLEKGVRWALLIAASAAGLMALVSAGVLAAGLQPDTLCCGDVYGPVNITVVKEAQRNSAYFVAALDLELIQQKAAHPDAVAPLFEGLYDTAAGTARMVKNTRFWGEEAALFLVLLSQLAIWYFCPERRAAYQTAVGEGDEALFMKA